MRGVTARLTLIVAVALSASTAAKSRAADMVPWVDDFQTAQQMAAARNQLILVHFYSNNCPPCRRLEKNVFNRPGFGHGVAQNYVPIRVNVSVSPDLARNFKVDRWPTDLLLTPNGEEIHRMVSPQDINEYLRVLNQFAWRVKTMPPGATLQAATQGFQRDRQSAASAVSSGGSPYQFVAQPAGKNSNTSFSSANSLQHDLGNPQSGITVGPTMMNPVMTNQIPTTQLVTNQSAPLGGTTSVNPALATTAPSANAPAAASPQATIAEAQRQIALAQQQIQAAQQQAAGPQVIENQFAVPSSAATPSNPMTRYGSSPTIPQQLQTAAGTGLPGLSPPTNATSQFSDGPSLSSPAPSRQSLVSSTVASPVVPQAAAPPQRPQPPTTEIQSVREFGMEGYCPVTLSDEDRWVKGDKRWGARHRGRLYLFQSAAAQQKFLAAPDRYSPALAGFDPVVFAEHGRYAEGLRNHGVRYQGEIYMFVSEESLSEFAKAPTRYAHIVRQAIGANRQMR